MKVKNTLHPARNAVIALFIIAPLLIPHMTHAAPVSSVAPSKTTAKTSVSTAPDITKEQKPVTPVSTAITLHAAPLAVRQKTVLTQFQDLTTRFTSIITRTQSTIDRLTAKNIDTAKAQIALTAATTALQNAKLAIDAFAQISVPENASSDEKTDKQSTAATSLSLKESAKKTEDSFKIVRESLILSLSELKISIAEKSDVSI